LCGGGEAWSLGDASSDGGGLELGLLDGDCRSAWREGDGPLFPFTHFAVIDAPPEA